MFLKGRVNQNLEPLPISLSTPNFPSCLFMISDEIYSPRPSPVKDLAVSSTLKKRSKTKGSLLWLMPIPKSVTATSTWASFGITLIFISLLLGAYLMALVIRFINTCSIRFLSAYTDIWVIPSPQPYSPPAGHLSGRHIHRSAR